ncbi:hypothetical protein ACFL7E_05295 [Thermodesulfobacteriota bacterium]
MKTSTHVYSSAILGGTIYALTQSTQMAVSAFVSGVLIDLDHLMDFLVFSGEKFSIKNFFSWFNDTRWEKVTLLFHSYEVYLLLCMITFLYPNPILVGILLGCGLHLALDQIGLRSFGLRLDVQPAPMYYFLSYRYYVGFHKSRLLKSYPIEH